MRHAALGELIARSDPAAALHRGLTAFLVLGDAGTFDGVFLTGLVAVVLASL